MVCLLATGPSSAQQQAERAPSHDIALTVQKTTVAGDVGSLTLVIAPRPGYSISRDGPLVVSLAVTPERGIDLSRRRYRRRHSVDARAATPRFDLAYRAVRTGRYTATVRMRFWVCGKRTCRPVRETRRVSIEVDQSPGPD
ncbi:MAG: hypothetical protein MJE77_02640 [Proteobacteria bacterium]|nr:hypothetical protein [Pseudomonadota bacterium]